MESIFLTKFERVVSIGLLFFILLLLILYSCSQIELSLPTQQISGIVVSYSYSRLDFQP